MKRFRLVAALLVLFLLSDEAIAGKSFSSGGKSFGGGVSKSFSGGSSKPSSFKPSVSVPKPSSNGSSGGSSKSFGSSSGTANSVSKAPAPSPPKVQWGSFFRSGARETESAQQVAKSKTTTAPPTGYQGGTTTQKDLPGSSSSGGTRTYKPTPRTTEFYSRYDSRPVIVYHDNYNPMWNYWLLDQSLDTMALWCYHHQASMDQQRLRDLYAQNAGLEAKMRSLEAENKGVRDVNYTPPNVDKEVIVVQESSGGFWSFVGSCFGLIVRIALVAGGLYGIYYLLFVFRF